MIGVHAIMTGISTHPLRQKYLHFATEIKGVAQLSRYSPLRFFYANFVLDILR